MRVEESDLSAYLDGEIDDPKLRAAIEAEIEKDPASMKRLKAASALLRDDMESPDIHDAIMQRAERMDRYGSAGRKRGMWFGWAVSAAALCVILFAIVDYAGVLRSGRSQTTPNASPIAASNLRIQGAGGLFRSPETSDMFDLRSAQCVAVLNDSVVIAWNGGEAFGVFNAGDSIDEVTFVGEVTDEGTTILANGRPVPMRVSTDARPLADCRIALSEQPPVSCIGWAIGGGAIILMTRSNEPVATAINNEDGWRVILSTDEGPVELTGETSASPADAIALAGTTDNGEMVTARMWLPVV